MTWYCINCWAEVAESAAICLQCGDDLAARRERNNYVDKLIAALHHPEPTIPIRAAWILGERREHKAVKRLMALVETSMDAFIAAAAVAALGRIGGEQSLVALRRAAQHESAIVRRAAAEAVPAIHAHQEATHD